RRRSNKFLTAISLLDLLTVCASVISATSLGKCVCSHRMAPHLFALCWRWIVHSLQRAGNRWHPVATLARSGDDDHRSGGAGAQLDVVRNLLHAHHHRYALRESDPLEGRLDGGQQLEARAAVLLGNAPADALDPALQGSVGITHQRD